MRNREFVFVWGFIILLFISCTARTQKIDKPHAIAKLTSIEIGDYLKWICGANRVSGTMWDELRDFDLFRDVPDLEISVWFIFGKNDYNTPATLVEEYAEFVKAPKGKNLIVMDGVAHTPFMGNPDKFNQLIINVKKGTIRRVP